ESALRCWLRERFGGGGARLRRMGLVAGGGEGGVARGGGGGNGGGAEGGGPREGSNTCPRGGGPLAWGWGAGAPRKPCLAKQPSDRWGRLLQDFPLSSQDAERIGCRVFEPARREGRWRQLAPTP